MIFSFSSIFYINLKIFCGKFLMSFVKFINKLKITLKFVAFLTVLAYFLHFNAYLFSPFFPCVYHLFFNCPLIFSIFLFNTLIFPLFSCFPLTFSHCQRIFSDFGVGVEPLNPPPSGYATALHTYRVNIVYINNTK